MEKTEILDENGHKTGKIMTMLAAHKQGLWHRSVHVWFINKKGELLLQLRSPKKKVWPNAWDISAAGHIDANQTSQEAATTEVKEEMGVDIGQDELQFLFRHKHFPQRGDFYENREFNDIYLVEKNFRLEDLKRGEEVTDFKFLPWREFKKQIELKTPGFVTHGEYVELFKIIEKKGY